MNGVLTERVRQWAVHRGMRYGIRGVRDVGGVEERAASHDGLRVGELVLLAPQRAAQHQRKQDGEKLHMRGTRMCSTLYSYVETTE